MTRAAGPAVAAAVAGALAFVALSGCGSVQQTDPGSASTASAPTSTPAPTTTRTDPMPTTPTGPPEDLTVPPTGTGGKQRAVRVRGTVSDGVEPGCRLLTSEGVVYLLIWRRGTLVTGAEVEVEGTVQPDLVTTCQQGTPLVVERVLSS